MTERFCPQCFQNVVPLPSGTCPWCEPLGKRERKAGRREWTERNQAASGGLHVRPASRRSYDVQRALSAPLSKRTEDAIEEWKLARAPRLEVSA